MKKYNNTNKKELTEKGNAFPLLDSKLITATKLKQYNIKVVECGNYVQVYLYENPKYKTQKNDTTDLELKRIKIQSNFQDDTEKNQDKIINSTF